jgi:membrane protein implicated in regulation of membrane protease activity
MSAWVIWIIVAAILAIAEILTSSFYLLLAAVGALCAALLAYLGVNDVVQIMAASLITLGGWIFLYKFSPGAHHKKPSEDSNMNMDIGAEVKISEILADKKLNINYRGSNWQGELHDLNATPDLNTVYVISAIRGSTLILSPKG